MNNDKPVYKDTYSQPVIAWALCEVRGWRLVQERPRNRWHEELDTRHLARTEEDEYQESGDPESQGMHGMVSHGAYLEPAEKSSGFVGYCEPGRPLKDYGPDITWDTTWTRESTEAAAE
jgi:hypothetical protein